MANALVGWCLHQGVLQVTYRPKINGREDITTLVFWLVDEFKGRRVYGALLLRNGGGWEEVDTRIICHVFESVRSKLGGVLLEVQRDLCEIVRKDIILDKVEETGGKQETNLQTKWYCYKKNYKMRKTVLCCAVLKMIYCNRVK